MTEGLLEAEQLLSLEVQTSTCSFTELCDMLP